MYQVYLELRKDRRILFVGPSGSEKFLNEKDIYVTCEPRPVWRYLYKAAKAAKRITRKCMPGIVIAGSGVMARAAINAGRSADARTICFIHGLDVIYPNLIYQKYFVESLSRFDIVIANSQNTARLAAQHGVPEAKVKVLNPGVEIQNSVADENYKTVLDKYSLGGKKLIISVGRIVPRKGIAEFIQKALPGIVRKNPDTLFVIVGNSPDTRAARRYSSLVQKTIVSTGTGKYIRQLGNISDTDLTKLLSLCRLMVFPVLNIPSDVEGFGMVALEAASHGIPTVAFDVGGVSDAISNTRSGYLVKSGDYAEFTSRINDFVSENNIERWRESSQEFALDYSWENYGARLREIISDLYI